MIPRDSVARRPPRASPARPATRRRTWPSRYRVPPRRISRDATRFSPFELIPRVNLMPWRASSKASDSGPPRAQVDSFSWTALREFEVQPNGYEPRSLFVAFLRDCRFFGVGGVQDHREEAHLRSLGRIPGHPVHRSRRLVERIPGLVFLDRLVVEGVLVFALQNVAEYRSGMVVR